MAESEKCGTIFYMNQV